MEGGFHAHDPRFEEATAPEGAGLGEIRLPGAVNFAFGGPDRDLLPITADTAVWAARLTTQGA